MKVRLTYAKSSNEARHDIHPDVHTPCLKTTANKSDKCRHEDRFTATKPISGPDARQCAEEASNLEKGIDSPREVGGVRSCVKSKIFVERRLS